jgi:hypothetical protein
VWKIQSYFPQNFLKLIEIELIPKEGRLRKGSRDVFGNLLKARMHMTITFTPEL